MYNDHIESCELYVLLNDTTASLCSVANESPEEEALLLTIVSQSASILAPERRNIDSLVFKLAASSHHLHDPVYRERYAKLTPNWALLRMVWEFGRQVDAGIN